MSKLLDCFDELLEHLNAEENDMALELRASLEEHIETAAKDSEWRSALEAGGVDNWEWYSECFPDEEDDE